MGVLFAGYRVLTKYRFRIDELFRSSVKRIMVCSALAAFVTNKLAELFTQLPHGGPPRSGVDILLACLGGRAGYVLGISFLLKPLKRKNLS